MHLAVITGTGYVSVMVQQAAVPCQPVDLKVLAAKLDINYDVAMALATTESARMVSFDGFPLITFNPHVLQREDAAVKLGKHPGRVTKDQKIRHGLQLVFRGNPRLLTASSSRSVSPGEELYVIENELLNYKDPHRREKLTRREKLRWHRLAYEIAVKLAGEEVAARSFAWGFGQVMGFNHHLCGYDTAHSMATAMMSTCSGEEQKKSMFHFIANNPIKKNGKTLRQATLDADLETVHYIYAGSIDEGYLRKLTKAYKGRSWK